MKMIHSLFGCTAVLALTLGAAAQTNSTIPNNRPDPGTATPPQTPSPGTQDDRQIPEGGRSRPVQPQNPASTLPVPGSAVQTTVSVGATLSAFPEKAAKGALTEVQMGQLARQKGSTEEVRTLGKMLVDDHNEAYKKIKTMADKDNLAIGSEIDEAKRPALLRLSELSGSDFDQAFAAQMVSDHQEAIAEYQKESTSADSEAWREFAKQSLPMLEKHLEAAQKLAGSTPTRTSSPGATEPGTKATAPGAPIHPGANRDTGVGDSNYGRPSPGSPQPRY